jgi:hypothetical protein
MKVPRIFRRGFSLWHESVLPFYWRSVATVRDGAKRSVRPALESFVTLQHCQC